MGIKHHGIKNLTQFAMEVVHSSGKEALSYYGKGNPNIKFDEDLVTEADFHLMGFFEDQLNSRFPEHQVFRNNQANKDYTHDEKRNLWIFDPLDGVA
ncbi:MAG: inositol monophosphatase family protein, partial [Desulfobacterales bacterium]